MKNIVAHTVPLVPVIDKIDAKIGTLQRRQDHLQRKFDRPEYKTTASAEFDRAEIAALYAALQALAYVKEVGAR